MRALHPKEVADIVFQTPRRLTNGVLERLSFLERAENHYMTRSKPSSYANFQNDAHMGPDAPLPAYARISMIFNEEVSPGHTPAEQTPEHPRALKKAMLELKAIGFSHQQIYHITRRARAIPNWMFSNDHVTTYRGRIAKLANTESENIAMYTNDNGFLGTQICIKDNDAESSYHTTDTSIVPAGYESILKSELVRDLKKQAEIYPDLLKPANAKKARRLIPA